MSFSFCVFSAFFHPLPTSLFIVIFISLFFLSHFSLLEVSLFQSPMDVSLSSPVLCLSISCSISFFWYLQCGGEWKFFQSICFWLLWQAPLTRFVKVYLDSLEIATAFVSPNDVMYFKNEWVFLSVSLPHSVSLFLCVIFNLHFSNFDFCSMDMGEGKNKLKDYVSLQWCATLMPFFVDFISSFPFLFLSSGIRSRPCGKWSHERLAKRFCQLSRGKDCQWQFWRAR